MTLEFPLFMNEGVTLEFPLFMATKGPLGFFTLRGRDHRVSSTLGEGGTLRVPLLMASEGGPLEFFTLQGRDHKVFSHMERERPSIFLYS
jgi:hypothetical protein